MTAYRRHRVAGFTLAELIMALVVASIVLAAVVTLAGATTAASEATDLMGKEQSHLRHISMRLTDLIKQATKATVHTVDTMTLWHDQNGDGLENADELTYIFREADTNTITIMHAGGFEVYPQCQNVEFKYKNADTFVAVFFSLVENGAVVRHCVCANLRALPK